MSDSEDSLATEIKRLLETGADLNQSDRLGAPPLLVTVMQKRPDLALLLLKGGADPKQADESGLTPLLAAIVDDQFELVGALLEAGADPNIGVEYTTPLFEAIARNQPEVVRILLKAGLDPNQKIREEWPLYITQEADEIMIALLQGGADLNLQESREEPFLFKSIEEGKIEVVRALLKAGADPNRAPSDFPGITPLKRAIEERDPKPEIVKLLLESGVDSNIGDDHTTPLQEAVRSAMYAAKETGDGAVAQMQVVELLLGAGADPDGTIPGGDDFAPLEDVLMCQNRELLKLLLEAGADPNRVGNSGRTPLMRAIPDNNTEIIKLLLEAGADPNRAMSDFPEETPLLTARDNPELVKLLVEAGAKQN